MAMHACVLTENLAHQSIIAGRFYGTQLSSLNVDHLSASQRILLSFPRQEAAYDYFESLVWETRRLCKIFSYESVHDGKRMFLVCHVGLFMHEYFTVIVNKQYRHVYEIIKDRTPCRLYFDLEYSKTCNSSLDGDQLTAKWISLVVWKLHEIFGLCLGPQHVLVLDSTTSGKFSKHVVFHCLGARSLWWSSGRAVGAAGAQMQSSSSGEGSTEWLFTRNTDIALLVQRILMDITRQCVDEEDTASAVVVEILIPGQMQRVKRVVKPAFVDLWVNSASSESSNSSGSSTNLNKKQCFVDLGVFTRNRAFRLFGSCKFGKAQQFVLQKADRQRYTAAQRLDGAERSQPALSLLRQETMLRSFVVPHDVMGHWQPESRPSSEGSQDDDNDEISGGSFCLNTDRYSLLPTLLLEASTSLSARDRLTTPSIASRTQQRAQKQDVSSSSSAPSSNSSDIARSAFSREPSWFPTLDEYVTSHCASLGGVKGVLTSWSLSSSTLAAAEAGVRQSFTFYRLKYQVLHNRWCANVQRQHRSNGIMLEVDLTRQHVTQTCWDVDCRGFRSHPMTLPSGLLPGPEELHSEIQDRLLLRTMAANPDLWNAQL